MPQICAFSEIQQSLWKGEKLCIRVNLRLLLRMTASCSSMSRQTKKASRTSRGHQSMKVWMLNFPVWSWRGKRYLHSSSRWPIATCTRITRGSSGDRKMPGSRIRGVSSAVRTASRNVARSGLRIRISTARKARRRPLLWIVRCVRLTGSSARWRGWCHSHHLNWEIRTEMWVRMNRRAAGIL